MKALKDWSKEITDIATIEDEAVLTLYSEMLATAHDINYTVPDDQLIETEDAGALRKVIPALHAGIIEAHATAQTAAAEKTSAKAKASTAKPEAIKKKKTAVAKTETTTKAPTKPASKAAQKVKTKEPETMATPTAKKTAKKAAPAAKKAAPTKGAAKKGTAKKAAKANARTPATGGGRNPFGESAVIKVLNKDTGIKADSERGKRVAVVMKYNGKKVADYFSKESPPYNRTDTLRFLESKGFISIK
jgi:outer membrane biosynthesis protein TonB